MSRPATPNPEEPSSRSDERVELDSGNWLAVARPTSALSIVTTVDAEGRANAAPFATVVRVNQEPLQLAFTCGEGSDTCANIQATGQFTLNLVSHSEDLLRGVVTTAKPWPSGIDEATHAGLTPLPAIRIRPPRLLECYAHLELETEWLKSWSGRCMVVGRVVAASARRDCLGPDNELVWKQARPVHYWGGAGGDTFTPLGAPMPIAAD
jgi:flavin reductase (DIM6/NTAB) family NADH-FMN oxidoreductase RutF